MQELVLAIVLVAATIGGLESVATVAVSWTSALIQAEDLEDVLDLDQPTAALDGDSADSELAAAGQ